MKYKPHYTLTLNNGEEKHLVFNTMMQMRLSEALGFEIEGLYQYVTDMSKGEKGFTLSDIQKIILYGAQTFQEYNGEPVTTTAKDVMDWIDLSGGFVGFKMNKYMELVIAFFSTLAQVDPSKVVAEVEPIEKKRGSKK